MRNVRIAVGMILVVACGKGEQAAPAPTTQGTQGSTTGAAQAAEKPIADKKPAASPSKPGTDAKAAAPAADALKQYRAALKKGRAADKKKDYVAAAAAFEEALAAIPGDPRALSELGWVRFAAGDLVKAAEATEASFVGADPKLEAASRYNLGRILEQKGDKPGAVAAYTRSLELRDNRTVRERLAALDPAAAAALSGWNPVVLQGPFPTFEAFCQKHSAGRTEDQNPACNEVEGPDEGQPAPNTRLDPEGPWKGGRFFWFYAEPDAYEANCAVALQLDAGWFVAPDIGYCDEAHFVDSSVDSFEVEDVIAGGAPEIVIHIHITNNWREYDEEEDMNFWASSEEKDVVYCGLGPGKVPSCTPPIGLLGMEGFEVSATFEGPSLVIAPVSKEKVPPEIKQQLGKHAIVFP